MAQKKRNIYRSPQCTEKKIAYRLCDDNDKHGEDIENMAHVCVNERTSILDTQIQLQNVNDNDTEDEKDSEDENTGYNALMAKVVEEGGMEVTTATHTHRCRGTAATTETEEQL
eukprot:4632404-Ditylum_brightwellii.AAC.1